MKKNKCLSLLNVLFSGLIIFGICSCTSLKNILPLYVLIGLSLLLGFVFTLLLNSILLRLSNKIKQMNFTYLIGEQNHLKILLRQ